MKRVLCALGTWIVGVQCGVCAAQDLQLPMRAIAIEGGLVSVQAGVMEDPAAPRLPFGKLKHPVLYVFVLKNETPRPAWAEVEMRLPGKEPMHDFGRLGSGTWELWRWRGFDVAWDQAIPARIAVYSDQERKKKLGEREMTLYFEGADKDAFYKPRTGRGPVAVKVISGWREMRESLCKVEGSAAAGTLLRDVCLSLWKYESVEHPDCEHPIAGMEPLNPADSALLAKQPAEFQARAEAFRAKGDLVLEKWTVKSCDAVTPYEVMMIKAPQGGTDILVAPVRPQPEGGSPPKG